jgi:short chain dehydrogenase
VNVLGTHGVTQAFLPLLRESSGAIVNVLSIAGLAGLPVMPAYSASKAAQLSLSQNLSAPLDDRAIVRDHPRLLEPAHTAQAQARRGAETHAGGEFDIRTRSTPDERTRSSRRTGMRGRHLRRRTIASDTKSRIAARTRRSTNAQIRGHPLIQVCNASSTSRWEADSGLGVDEAQGFPVAGLGEEALAGPEHAGKIFSAARRRGRAPSACVRVGSWPGRRSPL